ncbi:MAG: NAD-dependent epimerase/dehydratase family protein, partial [Alphaproteobacteria bacterium]|nr:NAD-dependent epimerase/dehydratase family protein [Alphaproteobacteria bacterium]
MWLHHHLCLGDILRLFFCKPFLCRLVRRFYLHLIYHNNFSLEEFDITDPSSVSHIINKYQPDEFYNLAAQSHVDTSFKQPSTTFEVNTIGVVHILD